MTGKQFGDPKLNSLYSDLASQIEALRGEIKQLKEQAQPRAGRSPKKTD